MRITGSVGAAGDLSSIRFPPLNRSLVVSLSNSPALYREPPPLGSPALPLPRDTGLHSLIRAQVSGKFELIELVVKSFTFFLFHLWRLLKSVSLLYRYTSPTIITSTTTKTATTEVGDDLSQIGSNQTKRQRASARERETRMALVSWDNNNDIDIDMLL